MSVTIECQKRPERTKPNALRRQGVIPATLYGHKGAESVSLALGEKEAYFLLRQASVNKTLIDLKIPDLAWQGKVLIREVQAHPWKKTLYHLSFFFVKNPEEIA
jgi:large subunit ribosomal protein L25